MSRGLLAGVRSLLSIGPGEGDLEIELAGSLERIGAIDPDGRALEIFRGKMRERGLEGRLGLCIADRFQAGVCADIHERFDLVLAVHSWYAIAYDRDALTRALALREPTGALALVLASREGMGAQLKALGLRAATDPTVEELSAWASKEGFAHTFELRRDPKPAALYVDALGLTDVGRALVGFLASTPWEDLAENVRTEGERIIRSHIRGGEIDSDAGWLVFR